LEAENGWRQKMFVLIEISEFLAVAVAALVHFHKSSTYWKRVVPDFRSLFYDPIEPKKHATRERLALKYS
jgi:hypothetical protein